MQPTALNKVVSLFLAGGLIILGLAYLLFRHGDIDSLTIVSDSLSGVGGEGFFTVIGGLLLLPLAALAGAASEGMTDLIIRPLVKLISEKPLGLRLFFQTPLRMSHDFWRVRFEEAAKKSGYLDGYPVGSYTHSLAVALLYESGQEESINWAESHYSTFVLATNFVLLAAAVQLYLILSWLNGWSEGAFILGATLVTSLVFYTCLCLSVDKYLYSYLVAMRQAAIVLLKENAALPVGPGAPVAPLPIAPPSQQLT